MKIRKIPDLMPEEKIHGFQLLIGSNTKKLYVALDIYICLNWDSFNFYCNYERGEYFALKLGLFNYGYTNLNYIFDAGYYESNDC
jgi:hypothetical protein